MFITVLLSTSRRWFQSSGDVHCQNMLLRAPLCSVAVQSFPREDVYYRLI